MRRWSSRVIPFVLLACGAFAAGPAPADAGEVTDLLANVPDDYNAVAAINAVELFSSRLAIAEGWREEYADAFAAAPTTMPPDSRSFVIAASLDVETFAPAWQSAAMALVAPRTVEQVAERTGGAVDRLGEFDAVWPRDDVAALALGPNRFALLTPATRQAAARWARSIGKGDEPPPFLAESVGLVDSGERTICFAMDLRDVLRPEDVAAAVERSEVLRRVNAAEASKVLATVSGVRASFSVDSKIEGEIVVQFARNCGVLTGVSGPLVASVMEQGGMTLDDVEAWKFRTEGATIVGSGPASERTLRRVLSLLSLDTSVVAAGAPATPPPPGSTADASPSTQRTGGSSLSATGRATVRYFKGVNNYIEDLEQDAQRRSPDQIAMWMDSYASRIDRLPTRDVDPGVVEFGRWASQSLHGAVANMHQAYEDTAPNPLEHAYIETGSLPTRRTVNYGGTRVRSYAPYSRAQIDIGSAIRSQKDAERNFEQTEQEAYAILNEVFSATADMRSKMTERYGDQF